MAPSSDYGKLIQYAASAQRFDGVQTPRRRQGLSYTRDNLKLQMILLTSSSETLGPDITPRHPLLAVSTCKNIVVKFYYLLFLVIVYL